MGTTDIRVAGVIRTITLELEPQEALRGLDYLNQARVHDGDVPYCLDLIRGAFAAVANHREYGGH